MESEIPDPSDQGYIDPSLLQSQGIPIQRPGPSVTSLRDLNIPSEYSIQARSIEEYWINQSLNIQSIDSLSHNYKKTNLPLSRLRRIMRGEDEIKFQMGLQKCNLSTDAPIVMNLACNLFIKELVLKAFTHTKEKDRVTLVEGDLLNSLVHDEMYDFFMDFIQPQVTTKMISPSPSPLPPHPHLTTRRITIIKGIVKRKASFITTPNPLFPRFLNRPKSHARDYLEKRPII